MGTEHYITSPEEIELIDDRVLVECLVTETKTKGGVLIPEETQKQRMERLQIGKVISIGPGRFGNDGRREAMMDIRPGDFVIFAQHLGYRIFIPDPETGIEEREYRVFGQHDLFGIKKEAPREEVERVEIARELYDKTRTTLSTYHHALQDGVDRKPTDEEKDIVDKFNILRG